MLDLLYAIGTAAFGIILEAGFWIVLSLLVAGLVHEFIDNLRFRKLMRHPGPASLYGAVGIGALLPTCSCGVIPLAVSFYLNGARLAAVITFAAATPVINPAAVVLSYALLGPELTLAYVAFGLLAPVAAGLVTERWAGPRQQTALATELGSCCEPRMEDPSTNCCSSDTAAAEPTPSAPASVSLASRLQRGLRWGLLDMGPSLGFYIGIGAILAATLITAVPSEWILSYLGEAAPFRSLLLVALLGASIYVCAVAHIPLVAALLAAGAAPGAAIVFLVTGAATNLPEFIALQKVLGLRTVLLYMGSLIALALFAGWLVNAWLLPGFSPAVDPLRSMDWLEVGTAITPVIPGVLAIGSSLVVLVLIAWGLGRWLVKVSHALRGKLGGRLRHPAGLDGP